MRYASMEILTAVAADHPELCRRLVRGRPLLRFALRGDESALDSALAVEETKERQADKRYWEPLRRELERLRHEKPTSSFR